MSLLVDDRSPAPGEGFEIALSFRPLLESWDRKAAPSQVRLEEYRQKIAALAAPALARLEPPLALGFYVAGRTLAWQARRPRFGSRERRIAHG